MPKPKSRQNTADPRTTLKLRGPSLSDRPATTENEPLSTYEDQLRETFALLEQTVEQKKHQHRRWNEHYEDKTWHPITPPAESADEAPRWGFLPSPQAASYPTPPPTLPSEGSRKDGDTEMADAPYPDSPVGDQATTAGASLEPDYRIWSMPGAWPREASPFAAPVIREPTPACRLRKGRGGIMHLEARKRRAPGLCETVVYDSDDSDDDTEDWFAVSDATIFDYRTALHRAADHRRSLAPEASIAGAAAPSRLSSGSAGG